MNLKMELPILLPKAIAWAEAKQSNIIATGIPLTQEQLAIAQEVGVFRPENIRIKFVNHIPMPDDPVLAAAAIQTGLISPDTAGMALYYGIFISSSVIVNRSLLAHEFRHVQQYEQKGSIANFLTEYLTQIVTFGYVDSPLEKDAISAATKFMS